MTVTQYGHFNLKVILAWDGIASRVMLDGEITLIIGGTGIKSEEAGYEPTDTDYRKGHCRAI